MIKKTGDKKVEEWTHVRSGLETVIYLRGTDFAATILSRAFEAPNIAILRSQMADYCEHWITMEWFGLIEIDLDNDNHSFRNDPEGATITFKHKRFWVSKSPAGEFFSCPWEVDEEHRKAKMEKYGVSGGYHRRYHHDNTRHDMLTIIGLPLGAPLEKERGTYLLDYTEELWQRFEGLVAGIEAMQRTIKDLVSTRKGLAQLLTGGGDKLLLKGGKRK